MPNLTPHSKQFSPSAHGGSFDNMSEINRVPYNNTASYFMGNLNKLVNLSSHTMHETALRSGLLVKPMKITLIIFDTYQGV